MSADVIVLGVVMDRSWDVGFNHHTFLYLFFPKTYDQWLIELKCDFFYIRLRHRLKKKAFKNVYKWEIAYPPEAG